MSRDSASEERGDTESVVGIVKGLDEGFETGEELGESREIWVIGKNGIGLGFELEESFNGGRVR